jgi:type I restriction enzyme S subunit
VTVRLWGKGVVQRREVTGAEIAARRRLVVRSQQFILSRIDARNGAFGLVPDSLDGAVVSNDFPVFTPNRSQILPTFLNWMSKTRAFVDLCKAASEGTTNRVRLVEDRFLATEIPLPLVEEQRRIVARIEELADKIDEARDVRRQAVEEADVLVQATARQLLGGVNAPITELESWLDRNGDGIQTGPFGAQLGSADFMESGIPVLTIGNVQYSGLRLHNIKYVSEEKARQLDRYAIRAGDILFARMGTVGRCCVVPRECEGWLINYHIIRVAIDKSRVEPRYIHWIIRASTEVERYLDEKIRGATRQGVNSAIVGAIPCRIPLIDEQRRIVAYLDDLQAKADAVKRLQADTAAELDSLLPSILNRAFKGEV